MRESLRSYCERTGKKELLDEWLDEENLPLTPDTISYGSKKNVWWQCKYGHKWESKVFTRTSGSGCPYCSHKRPVKGVNDFATLHPELLKEWHPTLNGDLVPEDFLPRSNQKIWWQCENGHTWKTSIKSRVQQNGCPYCGGKKLIVGENDLASRNPEIAQEWHPDKNGTLTPDQVMSGSNKIVWWRCSKGHEWKARVGARTSKHTGCPYCSGKKVLAGFNDLASQYPELAKQWHPEENGKLRPDHVTTHSNKKVWWLCPEGHEYAAVVASRVDRNQGCPYCAGKKVMPGFNDLATKYPEVASQWHPTLNGKLTPQMVTPGSKKKVWWQCAEGHVWQARIYSRTGSQLCGCPICTKHK